MQHDLLAGLGETTLHIDSLQADSDALGTCPIHVRWAAVGFADEYRAGSVFRDHPFHPDLQRRLVVGPHRDEERGRRFAGTNEPPVLVGTGPSVRAGLHPDDNGRRRRRGRGPLPHPHGGAAPLVRNKLEGQPPTLPLEPAQPHGAAGPWAELLPRDRLRVRADLLRRGRFPEHKGTRPARPSPGEHHRRAVAVRPRPRCHHRDEHPPPGVRWHCATPRSTAGYAVRYPRSGTRSGLHDNPSPNSRPTRISSTIMSN